MIQVLNVLINKKLIYISSLSLSVDNTLGLINEFKTIYKVFNLIYSLRIAYLYLFQKNYI